MGSSDCKGSWMVKQTRLLPWGIGLVFLFIVKVNGACNQPAIIQRTVNENDPKDTVVLNIPAAPTDSWRYVVKDPYAALTEFLEFTSIGDHYVMTLTKPLDLEELRDVYNIKSAIFQLDLFCRENQGIDNKALFLLSINAVNEFDPQFSQNPIHIYKDETQEQNIPIVTLSDWATDNDFNPVTDEIAQFDFLNPDPRFNMQTVPGRITAITGLDYESLPENKKIIEVGVKVMDYGGRTGTSTLIIHVRDVDDRPPAFTYQGCPSPCSSVTYAVSVGSNFTGNLNGIKPAPIKATDGDSLQAIITYSIARGPTGYQEYVQMTPSTGEIQIKKPLEETKLSELPFIVQAQEDSTNRRIASTTLLISVQRSEPPIPRASREEGDDDVVIVAAVMGVVVVIILVILVIAMIYYRKRYRKAVHPHSGITNDERTEEAPQENTRKEGKTLQDSPKPISLSDDGVKPDDDVTTWLPTNHLSDLVDLSDEDTIKRKKKNGIPPNSTKMASGDSAFEECSDKKSGSGDSTKDPDFDPVTEFAEVGMPTHLTNDDGPSKPRDHVYVPDPTLHQKPKDSQMIDSGVDEAEYLTPNSTRVKMQQASVAYNNNNNKGYRGSGTDQDTSIYSDLISIDDNGTPRSADVEEPVPANVTANIEQLEKRKDSNNRQQSHPLNTSKSLPNSHDNIPSDDDGGGDGDDNGDGDADAEVTEYSTPRSTNENALNDVHPPDKIVMEPLRSSSAIDTEIGPDVPPRPKIRQMSGLKASDSTKGDGEENQYASVQKKSSRKRHDSRKGDTSSIDNSNNNTVMDDNVNSNSKGEVSSGIDAPVRRKRHRKRSKHVKAPEEDVYDGTKDYEDLEMDPEFYLDTNKTRIKRSSKVPATKIDPDDTKYWITVNTDY